MGVDCSQLDSVMGFISKKIILELKEPTVWGKRVPHSRNSVWQGLTAAERHCCPQGKNEQKAVAVLNRSQVWLGHRQALVWRMQVNSEARGNQRGISRKRVTHCGISEVLFVCFTSSVLFLKDHVGCTWRMDLKQEECRRGDTSRLEQMFRREKNLGSSVL